MSNVECIKILYLMSMDVDDDEIYGTHPICFMVYMSAWGIFSHENFRAKFITAPFSWSLELNTR